MKIHPIAFALVCSATFGLGVFMSQPKPSVVYVGTQCQGASEIAVARRAMDLPPCAGIEIHQVAEGASQ